MRFMVECYLSGEGPLSSSESAARALAAAGELAREGESVRFLRSIYMPQDETHFLLYEAQSAALAARAAQRAGIAFERIVEAIEQEET